MIIAIDFDGTLCDHRFPEIGDEVPGAAVRRLEQGRACGNAAVTRSPQ